MIQLNSIALGEEKNLELFLPKSYQAECAANRRFPVVYLLDGEFYGQLAATVINDLNSSGEMPDVILAAITTGSNRIRDFTPSHCRVDWQGNPMLELEPSGGGSAFLAFLEKELIPYIDRHYRTAPHRTLVGHSLGGLMVLESFLTQQGLFSYYLASDPSLWFDHQSLAVRTEALNDTLALTGSLYCALSLHEESGPNENAAMISGNLRFVEAIKQRTQKQNSSTLRITFERFDDETHASVVPQSLRHGFKELFAADSSSFEPSKPQQLNQKGNPDGLNS